MTKVMMMLGSYPFMLDSAAYQQLKRSSEYRWKQLDRIGRKPAQQYMGPGADQITLSGEILPHWKGGLYQVDAMRAQAAGGRPLVLPEGHGGFVLGSWVILKIEETRSELMADGSPRVIKAFRDQAGSQLDFETPATSKGFGRFDILSCLNNMSKRFRRLDQGAENPRLG